MALAWMGGEVQVSCSLFWILLENEGRVETDMKQGKQNDVLSASYFKKIDILVLNRYGLVVCKVVRMCDYPTTYAPYISVSYRRRRSFSIFKNIEKPTRVSREKPTMLSSAIPLAFSIFKNIEKRRSFQVPFLSPQIKTGDFFIIPPAVAL